MAQKIGYSVLVVQLVASNHSRKCQTVTRFSIFTNTMTGIMVDKVAVLIRVEGREHFCTFANTKGAYLKINKLNMLNAWTTINKLPLKIITYFKGINESFYQPFWWCNPEVNKIHKRIMPIKIYILQIKCLQIKIRST